MLIVCYPPLSDGCMKKGSRDKTIIWTDGGKGTFMAKHPCCFAFWRLRDVEKSGGYGEKSADRRFFGKKCKTDIANLEKKS